MESKISEQEFLWGPRDGDTAMAPPQAELDIILESETVEIVEGGDAQPEGASRESTVHPPEGEEEQLMETNPPAIPVTPNEDDLLTGATAAATGVETELASLRVTSSPDGKVGHDEASI